MRRSTSSDCSRERHARFSLAGPAVRAFVAGIPISRPRITRRPRAAGGPREVALATYLLARLVDDCHPERQLPATAREERSTAARAWLANIALPAPVRSALSKLAEATTHDIGDIGPMLASVVTATSTYLDAAARGELDRLGRSFAT